MTHKKCYEVAEKFCKDNDFTFISLDSILKGNRIEITVGFLTNEGTLARRQLIIGCGQQEIEMEKFIYTVIRDDYEGIDGISVFHFNTHKQAKEWVKQDINRTIAMLNITDEDIDKEKDYWVYDDDSIVIDWTIRKLPLQNNDTWTDPNYTVKYNIKKGE